MNMMMFLLLQKRRHYDGDDELVPVGGWLILWLKVLVAVSGGALITFITWLVLQ